MTATPEVDSARVTAAATYVYGVIRSDARPPRVSGVGEAEVETIRHRDIAALASTSERLPEKARRRDLHAHADVLATTAARDTVLPARFGTVFESAQAVVDEYLEPRYRDLRRLLDEFEGLVELRVKGSYRMDLVLEDIVRASPRIAELREATRGRPEAATQGLRLDLGTAVAAEIDARRRADARGVVRRLAELAEDVITEDPVADEQVFRASFLVRRSRLATFDRTMEELAKRETPRLRFTYLGPLPPHSFVPPLGER